MSLSTKELKKGYLIIGGNNYRLDESQNLTIKERRDIIGNQFTEYIYQIFSDKSIVICSDDDCLKNDVKPSAQVRDMIFRGQIIIGNIKQGCESSDREFAPLRVKQVKLVLSEIKIL